MHRFVNFFLGLIFIFMVFFPCSIHAEESGARLVLVKGLVEFSRDNGKIWQVAPSGMFFPEGSMVRTGTLSGAAIMLSDRSQIRLGENAVLRIKSAGFPPGMEEGRLKRSILEFIKGKLWFRNKRKVEKPIFETLVVTGSIRGTELFIAVDPDGSTRFVVLEGVLLCENQAGRAEVIRGEEAVIGTSGKPRVLPMLHPEESVQWLLLTPRLKGPGEETVPLKARTALDYLLKNKTDKAFTLALEAVEEKPDSASAHVILATLYQKKGKFEMGLAKARKALNLDHASVPALIRCVELALGLDRNREAGHLLADFPGDDPVIEMLRGYLFLKEQAFAKAARTFEKALRAAPELARAHLGLGLASHALGEFGKALEYFETASLLNPLAAYPHHYLGKALLEAGEREEAEAELLRGIDLDPRDPTPHLYLAALKADDFRPGEAVLSYFRALDLNDNRLVERSSYLLDGDRAVKNINMAWSLGQLGLFGWAGFHGDRAVWLDPSAPGGYMFRSVRTILTQDVNPATLGDVRRETLLKPVNSNTYMSYNDYYSLLEQPEIKLTFAAEAGSRDSWGVDGRINGGMGRTAFYSGLVLESVEGTGGDDTERQTGRGDVSLKFNLGRGHELMGEVMAGEKEQGDPLLKQNGFLTPRDMEDDTDYLAGMAGYHWRHGPMENRHLLVMPQYRVRRHETLETKLMDRYIADPEVEELYNGKLEADNRAFRLDVLELLRIDSHRLALGGAFQTQDREWESHQEVSFSPGSYRDYILESDGEGEQGEERLFLRDIWFARPELMVDMGLAWAEMDDWDRRHGDYPQDVDSWLPSLGIAWDVNPVSRLRAAWFRELQPDYLNGSLQPVETAGFKRLTGATPGTLGWVGALAWDAVWGRKQFTSLSYTLEDRHYSDVVNNSMAWKDTDWLDERIRHLSLTWEILLTSQVGLSLSMARMEVDPEQVDGHLVDHEIRLGVSWVHPSGLELESSLWYVDQDGRDALDFEGEDSFLIGNLTLKKSFRNKRVTLYLSLENFGDETFFYIPREAGEAAQLPYQGSLAVLGCRFNF